MTDVVMPFTSGPQLAERLLAVRPQPRCIFVSGYSSNTVAVLDAEAP